MRIACVGYRDWALEIYDALARSMDDEFLIFRSRAGFDEARLRDFRPDLVLFYGWSWIVPADIIGDFPCIMLHPSPLPKYRGGSPLQNQIIAGESESAVTLFLMDDGLDSGPILGQRPMSLEGGISDIFRRITTIGTELTREILSAPLRPIPQQSGDASVFKRRKPEESEITIDELRTKPAKYLYDKIRMLQHPYPSAFIRTSDGKRLALLDARVDRDSA
jgi:methionyl-tRNA formyltransferase